jgi:hypothetical protein
MRRYRSHPASRPVIATTSSTLASSPFSQRAMPGLVQRTPLAADETGLACSPLRVCRASWISPEPGGAVVRRQPDPPDRDEDPGLDAAAAASRDRSLRPGVIDPSDTRPDAPTLADARRRRGALETPARGRRRCHHGGRPIVFPGCRRTGFRPVGMPTCLLSRHSGQQVSRVGGGQGDTKSTRPHPWPSAYRCRTG